ncbi:MULTISPECIES: ATP-binding protein [Thalassobaculum]|uniref:histidine kinase n=1 Tax=Thalassobaculum litoreum DSM 18839 TaxID=1123362 RepID=A0A8G2BF42_9PROT|nr:MULTISPECIES: ATP-binding protein [Thalassobaculum]SDF28629.1 two-component system, OmpR family, osmolarity sensor histidine kinase EnvZ [Thalassobaculum litoreum DSM 18839]
MAEITRDGPSLPGARTDEASLSRPRAADPPGSAKKRLKRYLPKTLFGRALLIIVTPLVLMQVISTYVFYERHWEIMTRRLVHSLAGDIAFLIEELRPPISQEWVAELSERADRHFDIELHWQPEAILPNQPSYSVFDQTQEAMKDAMETKVHRPYIMNTDLIDRRIEILVQLPSGVLQVLAHKKRLFTSTTYVFMLWMIGSSLVLFAIAIVFMRNQIRPIRRLSIAARAFGLGRDVTGFKPEGATEVRQASAAFLQMRDRINRQLSQRTEMLAGVSHDLRTPLTRMKLELAMLGDNEDIAELKADVTEMERMVEGYLAFARGEGAEVPVEIDVGILVNDLIANERRGGTRIVYEQPDDGAAVLPARHDALRRAVANLIQNAARYGSRVNVAVVRAGEIVEITVDDDGTGIPEDRREEAFQPFKRLEPSRNQETGGTGLGLTISRDIVRSHGGDLTLEDSPLGGLRAVIRLPI